MHPLNGQASLQPRGRRQSLGRPAELLVPAIKDNKGSLESDIPKNGKPNARVGLDPPITSRPRRPRRGVPNVLARDSDQGLVVANGKREIRDIAAARKRVSALEEVVRGAADFPVVCRDHRAGQKEQGRTRVRNALDCGALDASCADRVSRCRPLPEAAAVVHGSVRDVACIGAGVDVAEVVVARWRSCQSGSGGVGQQAGTYERQI